MKRAHYIVELWQTGNIGPHNIREIDEQPKGGFESYPDAERHLLHLSTQKYGLGKWSTYAIMLLYNQNGEQSNG